MYRIRIYRSKPIIKIVYGEILGITAAKKGSKTETEQRVSNGTDNERI